MRNARLYLLFLILFGIAVLFHLSGATPQSLADGLFSTGYAYSESQEGILFGSNEAKPSELLLVLAQKPSFILSPRMVEGNGDIIAFTSQSLVLQQVVLGGNQKITTTVVRVYDSPSPNAKWLGCQTDYGTAQDNETVDVVTCMKILDTTNSVLIEVDFPNASQSRPIVEVSSTRITIKPSKLQDITPSTALLLMSMFSNAQQLIQLTNIAVAQGI